MDEIAVQAIDLAVPLHIPGLARLDNHIIQCSGTGTTRTATFCLSGTGIVMHSGSGTGFGPGYNIKCAVIQKSKDQKLEGDFLGNNAASSIEKARFCTNFLLLKNCAK